MIGNVLGDAFWLLGIGLLHKYFLQIRLSLCTMFLVITVMTLVDQCAICYVY